MLKLSEKNNVLIQLKNGSLSRMLLGSWLKPKQSKLPLVLTPPVQENDHSVLTAGELVTIKQTVGNWSAFLTGGKNVRRPTEVVMEEIEVVLAVVVGVAHQILRVTQELVSTMLMPLPPIPHPSQVSQKNNGQLLPR